MLGRSGRGFPVNGVVTVLVAGALGVGFMFGRLTTPNSAPHSPLSVQAQTDPRELIPLVPGPGPGDGRDGNERQPGQEQPGQQGSAEECTVLLMRDGTLYRIVPRGRPPQQHPGPGDGPGEGLPGGDDELIPIEPFQGPPPPNLPVEPEMRT